MSVIHRYIVNEILKYIAIVLLVVTGLYLSIDFYEKVDDFIENNLPISKAVIFLIYKTPFIIAQIFPLSILLSVLITFGLMSKNNEILALRSSGVSVYYILKPIFEIGFLFVVFLFLFSETVVPLATQEANDIWLKEVRHEPAVISKEKNIWLKDNRQILHIRFFNRKLQTIFGISLYYFDEHFNLIRRIDGEKAVFMEGGWLLFNLVEQIRNKNSPGYEVTFYDNRFEKIALLPEDLTQVIKKSEEMNYQELYLYVKKIESEGYDATPYRVDLYAKIAFPFICIIMCMIGVGIALKVRMKEGLVIGVAYGLGAAFLYWIFYSFCLSLGYGEMLPPIVSAWAANFIFGCFGAYLLLNAD